MLHLALHDSREATTPMEFIVDNTGYFKVLKIEYHDGEKYPQLVKDGDKSSSLDEILQPLTHDKQKEKTN
jgi:hypothetical protein